MPRWLAHFCLVVGWLLTPVLAARLGSPAAMLLAAAGGAALLGFGTLFLWVRFMRRVPHLLSHLMAPRAPQEHTAIATGD